MKDAAGSISLFAIPVILYAAWLGGSLTIPVTVDGLTGSVLLVVTLMAALVLPRVPWAFAVTGALVVVTALAFAQLPATVLFSVPAPALLAAAALLAWLFNRTPRRQDPWLARLEGLLVGRYGVSRRRAKELVAEAPAAARQKPVARYARELADAEPPRRRGDWPLLPLLVLTAVFGAAVDGQWVLAGIGAVVLAWSLWNYRGTLRRS
ncbi:hypothetical protein [Paractinoplanes atraurantiacus]|uniref:hypothetical protein n=1 Tax=Paractinoplanes atraurantiacus TaxID=1036182 RepID=UPI00117872E3|nr:hypothetical protein [Actinoplanes atraurantiacus]